jgi:signal transduction histidine kinase/CheY-like chemotaxis protein
LTAPVAALTANANAIASGQRGIRADIQSGDEVEVLAAAFNQMLVVNEEALAKLQATTERALAADRLKSEFLANMSHEIRTPMNGVLGMSKLILTMPIDPRLRRYVSTIDASATALLTILDDVLDFSKMEAGKYTLAPCRFELAPLLQDVLELLASRAHDKDIELVSRIEPGIPKRLIGDPDRFRQILNNLVGNAIKFTEGGEVFLEVTMVSRSETEVLIRVEVTDTGIGIDAADLPKLYQAFSQLDGSVARRHGGTGLGLAISKRLVEMMGGEMQVRSEPGRGSTFGFTAHFAVKGELSDGAAPALPSDLSVLLVEPHRRTGDVLLEALGSAGVAAEHCETGARARTRLRSERFGIVIMNRDVGDSPAAELAAAIRAEPLAVQPRLILLSRRGVFSSQPGDEFCAELLKPVRFPELRDCLWRSGKHAGRVPAGESRLGRERGEISPPPTGVVANGRRVLVIDDNDVNRFVAVEHLQQRGYATDEAVDGRVALDKFMANEYACLLMDCQMPVMDGYAAARAIRKLESELGRERTPIIALTAHALAGERERVLAAGMDDFLSKPFRPSMLESLLRRYWEARPAQVGPDAQTLNAPAPMPKASVEREDLDPGVIRSDRLIRLFLERLPEQLAALGRAVDAQDSTELRALSHKLKGSALALGAYRMSETAAGLQRQAELGNLALLPRELRRLRHQYGVLVDLLEAELARRDAPSEARASRHP